MNNNDRQPKAVRVNSWGFETGRVGRSSALPFVGVFLIVVGLLLEAGQLVSGAQIGASAFFLVLGLIFVAVGLRDHNDVGLYVGLFIAALSLANMLTEAGYISGSGWGTLFLGIGVLALVPIRASTGRGWRWTAVIGAVCALWGGSDIASNYYNLDVERLVGPLLLVLLGVWILSRSGRSYFG
jgi:hypothetical protein